MLAHDFLKLMFLEWQAVFAYIFFLAICLNIKLSSSVIVWANLCSNVTRHGHDLLEYFSFTTLSFFTCMWACMLVFLFYFSYLPSKNLTSDWFMLSGCVFFSQL